MPLLRKGFKDSLSHDDLWTLVDCEQVRTAISVGARLLSSASLS